jgi:hypothetical protein
MSLKSNIGLLDHVLKAYKAHWKYVWGTYGQIGTKKLLNDKFVQYPNYKATWGSYLLEHENEFIGIPWGDCGGLIESYLMLNADGKLIYDPSKDFTDTSFYNTATKKDRIETIPEIPGIAVWFKGHIGIYIGDGYVIESRGTAYGVVKTFLRDRPWTHWLQLSQLTYLKDENDADILIDTKNNKLTVEGNTIDIVAGIIDSRTVVEIKATLDALSKVFDFNYALGWDNINKIAKIYKK